MPDSKIGRLERTGLLVGEIREAPPGARKELVPCTDFYPHLDDESVCYTCGWNDADHR